MTKKLHLIFLTLVSMLLGVSVQAADYATVSVPYSADFTASQDQFVIEDVVNDLGTAIWTQSSLYGMTATTYVKIGDEDQKYNHEGESWLISPIIDLAGTSTPTMSITDQVNKFFGEISEEVDVCVREAGGQWTSLGLEYTKPSSIWGGWQDRTANLAAYAGKKIQVGFHYIGHATTAGTYEVKSFAVTASAPVEKEEAGLSFDTANYSLTLGEPYQLPTLTNPHQVPVTYNSSNVSVATVDEQGIVTPLAAGQTTIKATSEETDSYKAGSASYLLVVREKGQAGTDAFQLVTDAASLAVGDELIIVNEENTFALSTTQNANNRAATDVTTESDGSIVPSNLVQVITLEGSQGAWNFNVGNAYLYAASSSGNQLKTEDNPDEKAQATITIADGVATIQFAQWDEKARTLMRFNPNNGNPIFSCYATTSTTGTALRVYRKSGGEVSKQLTISGTTPFDGTTTVTITPSNEDYAIYYTTDGSNPDGSGTSKLYTAPFTIDATTTVKAVEEDLGGNLSAVVEKTFVKNESTGPTAADIAAFKALEVGTEATLTLKNAQVLGVAGRDVYVRDASGAIDFYNLGLTFEAGQVLNGTITGKYDLYRTLPELTKTDATHADGFTAVSGTATPRTITIAQAKSDTYFCDLVKIEGVKIVSKEEGTYTNTYAYIGKDSVMLYEKKFNVELGNYNENDTYTVEGILVPFNGKYEIYLTKSVAEGQSPEPGLKVCNSIAEFKALEKNTEAELKLNNAVVLYATDRDVFVRDATGAIEFYNTGLTFTTGQVLNGSIIGKYSPFNNLPELAKTDDTNSDNITFTDGGAPVPVSVTPAQLNADTYLCDLVQMSKVTLNKADDGYTYAVSGEESIQLFDKFKIMEEQSLDNGEYVVTGILVVYRSNYQLYPTEIVTAQHIDMTEVGTFDPAAPAYNTAGQRVGPNYRGIVVQGGRKYVK